MGSQSSKTATDVLTPIADILTTLPNEKVETILDSKGFLALPTATKAIFTSVKQLVDNIDVNKLPEDERKAYTDLVGEYFALMNRLLSFLDEQTAVFEILVNELTSDQPHVPTLERNLADIRLDACSQLVDDIGTLMGKVVLKRQAIKGSFQERVRDAIFCGVIGLVAVGSIIVGGIGAAAAATAVGLAAGVTVIVGGAACLPVFDKLRALVQEAKSLSVMEGNLTLMHTHLEAVREQMSDTRLSYHKLKKAGVEHPQILSYAQKCLGSLHKARIALLRSE